MSEGEVHRMAMTIKCARESQYKEVKSATIDPKFEKFFDSLASKKSAKLVLAEDQLEALKEVLKGIDKVPEGVTKKAMSGLAKAVKGAEVRPQQMLEMTWFLPDPETGGAPEKGPSELRFNILTPDSARKVAPLIQRLHGPRPKTKPGEPGATTPPETPPEKDGKEDSKETPPETPPEKDDKGDDKKDDKKSEGSAEPLDDDLFSGDD